jgi:hypothetical protein
MGTVGCHIAKVGEGGFRFGNEARKVSSKFMFDQIFFLG